MAEEGQTVHTVEVFAVALRNWRDGGGAFKFKALCRDFTTFSLAYHQMKFNIFNVHPVYFYI
jgi:hypothetical protein